MLSCRSCIFTFCHVFFINIHRLKLSSQVLNQTPDSSLVMYHFTNHVSEATCCDKLTQCCHIVIRELTNNLCVLLESVQLCDRAQLLGYASVFKTVLLMLYVKKSTVKKFCSLVTFFYFIFFYLIDERKCLSFIS